MSAFEDVAIRASHPSDETQRRWAWVAVEGGSNAVGVFVAYQPSSKANVAYERGVYVVAEWRRRRIATMLMQHAREALAAEDPPITLRYSGIATEAGYRLAQSAGIEPEAKRAAVLAGHGVEYENLDPVKASEEGLGFLHAAAAGLGLPVPGQ